MPTADLTKQNRAFVHSLNKGLIVLCGLLCSVHNEEQAPKSTIYCCIMIHTVARKSRAKLSSLIAS